MPQSPRDRFPSPVSGPLNCVYQPLCWITSARKPVVCDSPTHTHPYQAPSLHTRPGSGCGGSGVDRCTGTGLGTPALTLPGGLLSSPDAVTFPTKSIPSVRGPTSAQPSSLRDNSSVVLSCVCFETLRGGKRKKKSGTGETKGFYFRVDLKLLH